MLFFCIVFLHRITGMFGIAQRVQGRLDQKEKNDINNI
jgi:hypothetical protein